MQRKILFFLQIGKNCVKMRKKWSENIGLPQFTIKQKSGLPYEICFNREFNS